jgi:hypothetical protein
MVDHRSFGEFFKRLARTAGGASGNIAMHAPQIPENPREAIADRKFVVCYERPRVFVQVYGILVSRAGEELRVTGFSVIP